ncbi:hypothetical protein CGMCC3_g12053 [Colletotrichum fructicola]|nr:uncharacterized protein CGMCC3_g12053 [Colletotrichum fructicola]KAE9571829.1 hypothetical protein CGMCC3_g12053 [Colletotrichum fructicola]
MPENTPQTVLRLKVLVNSYIMIYLRGNYLLLPIPMNDAGENL